MLVSLVYSNVLATVAVASLPIVGRSWVAPKLSPSVRRHFFALAIGGGIPFALGQYAQADEWGSLWVQYHLLDLSYAPWGMALVMCLLSLAATLLKRSVSEKVLIRNSIIAVLAFGYGSEIWDTCWALHDEVSVLAVDVGDYITITVGAVVAVAFYVASLRATAGKVTS